MNNKRLKTKKYESEDTKEIKNLILITLGIIIIVLGFYFLTNKKLSKNNSNVEFDYSTITVGEIFNRPYSEYYVFLYDGSSESASSYKSLVSKYEEKEEAIKIYTVDLSQNLDNKYISEESNHNPSKPSEVKIKDSALILIKDGKVEKYFETDIEYEKVLN